MIYLAKQKNKKATDIHIEVRNNRSIVRYKINGGFVDIAELSKGFATSLAQAIFVTLSNNDDFNPKSMDSIGCNHYINGEKFKLRMSLISTGLSGFDVAIKIYSQDDKNKTQTDAVPLKDLGYSDEQISLMNIALAMPGLFIVSGKPGSGKTTLLKNMMLDKIIIESGAIKVVSVENPLKQIIDGATQIEVDVNEDGSFEKSIEGAIKLDPDVLMIANTDINRSIDILVKANQSGKKIITSIVANSAINTISRLKSMGFSKETLASPYFISGIVYQQLIPVLCDSCKVPYHKVEENPLDYQGVDSDLLKRIDVISISEKTNIFFKGDGCSCCDNGYVGETIVAEILFPDKDILKNIYHLNYMEIFSHWKKHGGKTILSHAIDKMRAGSVSPVDIENRINLLTVSYLEESGNFNFSHETKLLGCSTNKKPKAVPVETSFIKEYIEKTVDLKDISNIDMMAKLSKSKDVYFIFDDIEE